MSEITVVMPVYNGAEFLEESINSILNQTFDNFKFLILNDNSTDNTADILDDYQKKDSRIQVIHKTENKGPAHLRNEGIALAKTDFIALIDADDIALPSRFEKQVSFLINNPDYGVCGTWFTFFGDKKNRTVKHQASHEGLKVQMLKNCCIGNPTVMLRKSHLGSLRFENEYVPAEDYRLWSQLIARTKFHNIQEPLLLYRWHPNNISQTKIENLTKVEVIIKEQQLQNLGISLDHPNLKFYLNAVNLHRQLSKAAIIKTIESSKELKALNSKTNFYNPSIFEAHIDKIIIRTIRNAKAYDYSFYKYIKNDSGYFVKIPMIDKVVLFFKCLF